METIFEKVTFVLQNSKKVNNKFVYNPEFVKLFLGGDPDLNIIEEKSKKVIDLFNEALEKGDTDFMNRDFETDIWNLI
jgi:hypothetical protein